MLGLVAGTFTRRCIHSIHLSPDGNKLIRICNRGLEFLTNRGKSLGYIMPIPIDSIYWSDNSSSFVTLIYAEEPEKRNYIMHCKWNKKRPKMPTYFKTRSVKNVAMFGNKIVYIRRNYLSNDEQYLLVYAQVSKGVVTKEKHVISPTLNKCDECNITVMNIRGKRELLLATSHTHWSNQLSICDENGQIVQHIKVPNNLELSFTVSVGKIHFHTEYSKQNYVMDLDGKLQPVNIHRTYNRTGSCWVERVCVKKQTIITVYNEKGRIMTRTFPIKTKYYGDFELGIQLSDDGHTLVFAGDLCETPEVFTVYSEAKCAKLEQEAAAFAVECVSQCAPRETHSHALPLLVLREFIEPDAYVQTLRYSCF